MASYHLTRPLRCHRWLGPTPCRGETGEQTCKTLTETFFTRSALADVVCSLSTSSWDSAWKRLPYFVLGRRDPSRFSLGGVKLGTVGRLGWFLDSNPCGDGPMTEREGYPATLVRKVFGCEELVPAWPNKAIVVQPCVFVACGRY